MAEMWEGRVRFHWDDGLDALRPDPAEKIGEQGGHVENELRGCAGQLRGGKKEDGFPAGA